MRKKSLPGIQDGAVLIFSLVLLVVVTILAISGMNTAITGLAMARNDQSYENAFQAAETGLAVALSQRQFNTLTDVNLVQNVNAYDSVATVIKFEGSTQVPDRAFSPGGGSGSDIAAYHFLATATAKSKPAGSGGAVTDRDATATHTQAFYVLGPADAGIDRLQQGGIAPAPTILFPSPDDPGNCEDAACVPPPIMCIGVECREPLLPNNPVRTVWTQDGIQ